MIDSILITNMKTTESMTLSKAGNGKMVLDNEGVDWGEVEASIYTYKSPKQIGAEVSGVDIEPRPISVIGWLYGTQAQIEESQFELGVFFIPGSTIRISAKGYFIEGVVQNSPAFSKKVKENNEYMCKFIINIYCGNPEFIKEIPTVVDYGSTSPALHFPFHFTSSSGVIFGIKEIQTLKKIENKGVHQVGSVIHFRCVGDSIKSPKIFNVYNQEEFILIDKTLTYGEEVIINTNMNKQSVTGIVNGVKSDYFKYWNFGGTWIQIPVGDTYLAVEYEGSAGALEVSVETVDTYYSIEGM